MGLQRPDTLAQAISKYVRDSIVSGRFPPGSRLPEVALARELNTSRGTVREAVRTLADGGLVELVPHRGMFVSELTARTAWEITSMRALLEPYAARLALETHGLDPDFKSDVYRAFQLLSQVSESGDALEVADADVMFHHAVFARCDHQMLLSQLKTIGVLQRRLVLSKLQRGGDEPSTVVQHAPIVAAIDSGDPERLESTVRHHVIRAGELWISRMTEPATAEALLDGEGRPAFGAWPLGVQARDFEPV